MSENDIKTWILRHFAQRVSLYCSCEGLLLAPVDSMCLQPRKLLSGLNKTNGIHVFLALSYLRISSPFQPYFVVMFTQWVRKQQPSGLSFWPVHQIHVGHQHLLKFDVLHIHTRGCFQSRSWFLHEMMCTHMWGQEKETNHSEWKRGLLLEIFLNNNST